MGRFLLFRDGPAHLDSVVCRAAVCRVAAISFSIALFTSVLFRRRWYAIAIFVWAALLAYSRIYLGVHYPMDILFGLLLGLSLAAVSVRLCLRRMRRTEEVSPGSSEKDAL